ncbi:MAG: hypothetical protein Rubg2KO_28810 [Rubricoccaceae bacterium]
MWLSIAMGLVVALGIAGCSRGVPEDNPVVATVDGLAMTQDDVLRSYIDYLITTGQNDTEALRERHVEALIDAYLLGAEAERRGLATDSALQVDAERTRRRFVGARFYEMSAVDTLSELTDEEVAAAFALGKEQRVVRQLFYRNAVKAQQAYVRLQSGRSFLEEAMDLYATDDSSAGSLGAVSYWQLDDAFAEAAFSTPVGTYSEPVRSRMGVHIILVEDRIRSPLMTESEFERRRKGLESQMRLRRRRLEGDTFVRTFMEARNVAVNRPALEALAEALSRIEDQALPDAQQGRQTFTLSNKQDVLEALSPSTPLATFELDGQAETFTLADYVFWLDDLPVDEAKNRTGASLGRALRNEALARAGEAAGIGEEATVRHELERLQRLRLADALRAQLRQLEDSTAGDRLDDIARDLQLDPRQTVVDGWAVAFSTREAAELAIPDLTRAPDAASSRSGYQAFESAALRDLGALVSAVRVAPLGDPVLASLGQDQWVVVRVSDRRAEATGTGGETLAPFAAEADLIRQLRESRPLTLREERIRQLISPPAVPEGRR